MEICTRIYRPRKPKESPLFRLVSQHIEDFLRVYPERFAKEHGPLRPVVERVLPPVPIIRETASPGRLV